MLSKGVVGDASLAVEVAEVLRDRIINGQYAMGEKLIENKLADELKVSRTPVRNAFKLLAKEQLVEYIPNKGCFAKGFNMKDMEDIYAVRKAVEQLAVTWAIENSSEEKILDLKEQLELMRFYTKNGMYEKLLKANEDFHNMVFEMTGSRFIVQILKTYQDYVHIARKNTLKKEENLPDIFKEHEKIYQAIASADIPAALEAVEIHMVKTSARAKERWEETGKTEK